MPKNPCDDKKEALTKAKEDYDAAVIDLDVARNGVLQYGLAFAAACVTAVAAGTACGAAIAGVPLTAGADAPVVIVACPAATAAYAAVGVAEVALINAVELKEKAEIKANQCKRLVENAAKDLLHCEKEHGAAADDSSDASSEDYSNYDDEVNSSEDDDEGDEGDTGDEDANYTPSYDFTTEDLNDF